MICGHKFQQGITCNQEISFKMGFKLGMCASCYQLTQDKRRKKIEDEEIEARRAIKERMVLEQRKIEKSETVILEQVIKEYKEAVAEEKAREVDAAFIQWAHKIQEEWTGIEEEKASEKEEEKKRVNVAIRHRHSKLGVRY